MPLRDARLGAARALALLGKWRSAREQLALLHTALQTPDAPVVQREGASHIDAASIEQFAPCQVVNSVTLVAEDTPAEPFPTDWEATLDQKIADTCTGDLAAVADRADALYLEADVHSAEGQAAIQGLLPRYGFNPPGVTLSSMLDAETQALLAAFAPTVGASPAMLDPMRPWLAQVVLAVGQMQALGLEASAGADTKRL